MHWHYRGLGLESHSEAEFFLGLCSSGYGDICINDLYHLVVTMGQIIVNFTVLGPSLNLPMWL